MTRLVVLLAALAIGLVACGGDSADSGGSDQTVTPGDVPFDLAFIDAMVPHHREAIAMAKAAKSRGLSASDLEDLANDIVRSQQLEIDQMLGWRQAWFGSRTLGPIRPEVLGVPEEDLGMEHGSADDIAEAADVDAAFAQLMIPHHEGAIAMAEVAEDRAQHQETGDLAARIIEAQEREIDILEMHASGEHHG